jgi:hypothetical protein
MSILQDYFHFLLGLNAGRNSLLSSLGSVELVKLHPRSNKGMLICEVLETLVRSVPIIAKNVAVHIVNVILSLTKVESE